MTKQERELLIKLAEILMARDVEGNLKFIAYPQALEINKLLQQIDI